MYVRGTSLSSAGANRGGSLELRYSRISLSDVAQKLQLDGREEAEYIVAKCIRDGVIDAGIVHEEGYVRSNEVLDIYGTSEPQGAFHSRIQFCLNLYNDSVRAMRYAPNAYRKYLDKSDDGRERAQTEADIAEMEEEEEGDF
jgi:26S proteasome regulatory subunit N3